MANPKAPFPKDLGQALEQAPQITSLINRVQTEWKQASSYNSKFDRYQFSKFFGDPTYRYKDTQRNLRLWNVNKNILYELSQYDTSDEQAGRKNQVWEDLRNENTKSTIKKLSSQTMTAEEYLMHTYVGGLHLALDLKESWPGINDKNLAEVLSHIRSKLQIEVNKVKSTLKAGFDQQSFDLITQHIDEKTHYWELVANLCSKEPSDTTFTKEDLSPIFQAAGIIPTVK